jgi:hypothetical protein
MNLLDHTNIRDYRPRCGRVVSGTHQFETVPPSWSPPRLQILQSEYPDRLMQWVSTLLARDDLHACAVSPAAVGALHGSDSMSNPLLMPHYTITVIYQERITPPPCEPVDQTYAAA